MSFMNFIKIYLRENKINLKKPSFLESINLPNITNAQALQSESIISETELLEALKFMKNNKSLGNDGITKEFYEFFYDGIKIHYLIQ